MIFNLKNEYEVPKFIERVKELMNKGEVVELTKKSNKRTLAQNSYLYLILSYFGTITGYTKDEVKLLIFKKLVNPKIFSIEKVNSRGVKIKTFRSTSELNTSEMTMAIERFRNYSAAKGIYIPAPNENEALIYARQEVEKNEEYL